MQLESENYFVCLIDMMGQKKFFEKIQSPDVSPEIFDNIVRVSNGLRMMVKYITNRYGRCFNNEGDVGVELFSDSLLLFLKDADGDWYKLTTWFEIIMKVIYIACKYKLPFRGSIVKGLAYQSEGGGIYGDAVDEAIYLEKSRADSFRVIFSHKLAYELMSLKGFECDKYLEQDTDSSMVLNYAGPKIIQTPEFSKERQMLPQIREWISERISYFSFKGIDEHDCHSDPKLARRFMMWNNYLELESRLCEMRNNVRGL